MKLLLKKDTFVEINGDDGPLVAQIKNIFIHKDPEGVKREFILVDWFFEVGTDEFTKWKIYRQAHQKNWSLILTSSNANYSYRSAQIRFLSALFLF